MSKRNDIVNLVRRPATICAALGFRAAGRDSIPGGRLFGNMNGGPKSKIDWLTPRFIIQRLGPFDLDPASPIFRPWPTAAHHLTIEDDGLTSPWFGRVWLNPPYGQSTGRWLARLASWGDGIALTFARTETRFFHREVWARANAVLFFRGRLTFHNADGTLAHSAAGAPSCLVAYGRRNVKAIVEAGFDGYLVNLR